MSIIKGLAVNLVHSAVKELRKYNLRELHVVCRKVFGVGHCSVQDWFNTRILRSTIFRVFRHLRRTDGNRSQKLRYGGHVLRKLLKGETYSDYQPKVRVPEGEFPDLRERVVLNLESYQAHLHITYDGGETRRVIDRAVMWETSSTIQKPLFVRDGVAPIVRSVRGSKLENLVFKILCHDGEEIDLKMSYRKPMSYLPENFAVWFKTGAELLQPLILVTNFGRAVRPIVGRVRSKNLQFNKSRTMLFFKEDRELVARRFPSHYKRIREYRNGTFKSSRRHKR